MHLVEEVLVSYLERARPKRVLVAYSGGSDSTALLLGLSRVCWRVPVVALHANHGLQDDSVEWESHCIEVCRRLNVKIAIRRLQISLVGNLESMAREKRYAYFSEFVEEGDLLLLGHHLQDQVETSLMRVFQGRGLIQMKPERSFGAGLMIRPFIGIEPNVLKDYLRQLNFSWIEDPSNKDLSFDRNYIREKVLPVIAERWPSHARNFSRVLAHSASVDKILQDQKKDLPDVVGESLLPKDFESKLVWIRSYLEARGYFRLTDRQIRNFLVEFKASGKGELDLGGALLGAYRGRLYYELKGVCSISKGAVVNFPYVLDVGWGLLHLEEVDLSEQEGFFCSGNLHIKFRSGGEKMSLGPLRLRQKVKNMLSDRAVPTWRRESYPLIYVDGKLVCVPEIGIDQDFEIVPGCEVKRIQASILEKQNIDKV